MRCVAGGTGAEGAGGVAAPDEAVDGVVGEAEAWTAGSEGAGLQPAKASKVTKSPATGLPYRAMDEKIFEEGSDMPGCCHEIGRAASRGIRVRGAADRRAI